MALPAVASHAIGCAAHWPGRHSPGVWRLRGRRRSRHPGPSA